MNVPAAQDEAAHQLEPVPSKRLKVSVVAASLRYVGGQSVQADLLVRQWRNDAAADVEFIPIDPELPSSLQWVERVPLLRTVVRQPFYLASLWRAVGRTEIAHIFCELLVVSDRARTRPVDSPLTRQEGNHSLSQRRSS